MLVLIPVLWFAAQAAGGNQAFEALSRQAAAARDANRLDEAATLYRKALQARPAWDEGWWILGNITYDRDRYAECAPAFARLVSLKPDLAAGWIMSGLCEYALHHYEDARRSLLRAERLKFDAPPELSRAARLHLALSLTKTGAFERAIVLLTELTRMDRKTPEIGVAAGIAGLRRKWVPSEVPEADREMVAGLGDAMASVMEQDQKGAIAKFEALLRNYPAQPDIHFRFGAFLLLQSPERGMEEIRQALTLDPGHIPALVGLTMIYLKNGDTKTALEYGQRAVQADPGDYATHVALGRVYLDADDAGRAVDQLEVAVRLEPASADAHYSLASAYSRMGRKEDAQREQDAFRLLRSQLEAGR